MFIFSALLLFVPVFVIWATFGPLAYRAGRHGLIFTFVGIAAYIAALLAFGFLCDYVDRKILLPRMADELIDYASVPLAYGSTWLFYYLLKRYWTKERIAESEELLDDAMEE
jgi:hypothetical protein